MHRKTDLYSRNLRLARKIFGVGKRQILLKLLEHLSAMHFDIASGDLALLNDHWYVTHTGLLRMAKRRRCSGIEVEAVVNLCNSAAGRYVFKANVYNSRSCRGFVGFGDADPSNVSFLVHGAEMRVAETRAVNRALRKAYGIGIGVCSVDEIGSFAEPPQTSRESKKLPPQPSNGNGNHSGPKVRDRLCQLIRQHQLDPNLVKAYATDFCGTKTLREATRERVENFVKSLAESAEKDRKALVCQLNSYSHPKQEVVA
jgi:hypothetical protein